MCDKQVYQGVPVKVVPWRCNQCGSFSGAGRYLCPACRAAAFQIIRMRNPGTQAPQPRHRLATRNQVLLT